MPNILEKINLCGLIFVLVTLSGCFTDIDTRQRIQKLARNQPTLLVLRVADYYVIHTISEEPWSKEYLLKFGVVVESLDELVALAEEFPILPAFPEDVLESKDIKNLTPDERLALTNAGKRRSASQIN